MAHRDIIIVTAYFRPEFLHTCLYNIYNCRESLNKDVWVYHDQKFDDCKKFPQEFVETEEVMAYWKRGFGNRFRAVMRPENGFYGNSYNVLGAYAKAYETDSEYVYLIEDDVFITPDFFKWHEAVQKEGDYFCTIAGQCDRNPDMTGQTAGGYFESQQYASLGVGWKRENLRYVTEHNTIDYFHNPTPYIMKRFPSSTFGLWAMEQDGLIQRVMEEQLQKSAWAAIPKAYHVGLWGYHRSIGQFAMEEAGLLNLPLKKKIENLCKAVSDKTWLNRVADFQSDIQPFPTDAPQWDKVSRI